MSGRWWSGAATGCRSTSNKSWPGSTETGVPEALYEPLFARLRASANVVPVLEAAAVIGRQMDRGLLCAVVDLSDDEVDDVIDELEDALVLEPWGTDNWRFRHELLREVAAELAPPSVRRGLHAKVADALVGDVGGEPDWRLVAAHYERAERFDEAASAYQQASSDGAASRRAGRGAHLPEPCPRAARPRGTRPGPRPPRDGRCGWSGDFSPRPRRAIKAAPLPPTSSGACSWPAPTCATTNWSVTLVALMGYYTTRADLRRIGPGARVAARGPRAGAAVVPSDDRGLYSGWWRGCAASSMPPDPTSRRPTAVPAAADQHQIDAVWFNPSDPIAGAHIHLALIGLVRGDLTGAEAELAHAARRAERTRLPPGSRGTSPTRAAWRAGCGSRPVSSTGPRSCSRT